MAQIYAHTDADGFVLGFYVDELHGDAVPADATPIDNEHHALLLDGQSAGKRMKVSEDGLPLLVDPAPPTDEELSASLRLQRDTALARTNWLVERHRDETMFSDKTTLTKDQAAQLGAYRQALRDLPSVSGFPHVELPTAPDFIGV
ncbi:phage tail assembly chaperone [Paraburkholderia phenoliruptrix]|uniref:phage tail assembly chaperone n=1 Tax=Paraburkholderia phenoliruptrix TaxID=252970 RepID=UPI0034CECA14